VRCTSGYRCWERRSHEWKEFSVKKISKAVRRLLFEAYRRNQKRDSFMQGQALLDRWLGLGTEAAYRPVLKAGLMRFSSGPPAKRCMGWLVLTRKGANLMRALTPEFIDRMNALVGAGYNDSLAARFQLAGGITRR
jgi:hypothetical protein